MKSTKFPSRALRLLSALLDARDPMTLLDIRENVEDYAKISESEEAVKKRLQRDRQLLARAGIVIDTTGGYSLESEKSFTKSLPLSDEERLALLFLEKQLPEDPALAQAFAKLNALVDWPEHLKDHANRHYRFDHPHTVDPIVKLCSEALALNRCVEFTYEDASGGGTTRRIEPFHMAYTKGSWYLLGWCHLRKDYRSFNCHRMSECTVLDEPIDEGREQAKDEAELFKNLGTPAFLYDQGKEYLVTVSADPEVAFMIQDKNWPVEWKIQEDGSLWGDIPTRDGFALFAALLPYLSHIEIKGPDHFKKFCRKSLDELSHSL